jgi:electron transfer DM13
MRMKIPTAVLLVVSHGLVAAVGFAAGVYFLPILIAPPPPNAAEHAAAIDAAQFKGKFRPDLRGSDALHWGDGTVYLGRKAIALKGKVAPGPDYKIYLSPEFIDTRADFLRVKPRMLRVGEVKTFENFVVPIAESVDLTAYNTVAIWCERFQMFITASTYR